MQKLPTLELVRRNHKTMNKNQNLQLTNKKLRSDSILPLRSILEKERKKFLNTRLLKNIMRLKIWFYHRCRFRVYLKYIEIFSFRRSKKKNEGVIRWDRRSCRCLFDIEYFIDSRKWLILRSILKIYIGIFPAV